MKFNKPAKTIDEQIDLLKERGLTIHDRSQAQHTLSHINYYRLRAYWMPFESDVKAHVFRRGTQLESILNLYRFDRALRNCILDALERIEVSFKTQWAYQMAVHNGPHGYHQNSKGMVIDPKKYRSDMETLDNELSRSKEKFIEYYKVTYQENYPPIWVITEIISLGTFSRLYSNLKAFAVRRKIAATYGFDESFLEGFLEHITYLRNTCAHHNRLWNKHLVKKMPLPRTKPKNIATNIYIDQKHKSEHKLYNSLVMIQHLMTVIAPESDWAVRLGGLITKHQPNIAAMGFPEDWKTRPIWQAALNQYNHKDLNNADS